MGQGDGIAIIGALKEASHHHSFRPEVRIFYGFNVFSSDDEAEALETIMASCHLLHLDDLDALVFDYGCHTFDGRIDVGKANIERHSEVGAVKRAQSLRDFFPNHRCSVVSWDPACCCRFSDSPYVGLEAAAAAAAAAAAVSAAEGTAAGIAV